MRWSTSASRGSPAASWVCASAVGNQTSRPPAYRHAATAAGLMPPTLRLRATPPTTSSEPARATAAARPTVDSWWAFSTNPSKPASWYVCATAVSSPILGTTSGEAWTWTSNMVVHRFVRFAGACVVGQRHQIRQNEVRAHLREYGGTSAQPAEPYQVERDLRRGS